MARTYFAIAILWAACSPHTFGSGQNLLFNPNFDGSTVAWRTDPATDLSHVADDGDLTPDGAAQVEGGADLGEEGLLFSRLFQCVDVSAQPQGVVYEVGGSFNPLNYSPESCVVFAGFYSDRECLNEIGRHDTFQVGVPSATWSRQVSKTDPIPVATQSISLNLDCRFASDTPSPMTRYDDVILHPAVDIPPPGSGRNLLLNPKFDGGTDAWATDLSTVLSHVSDDGDLTPNGAAQVEGGADLGEEETLFARLFQCVDVGTQVPGAAYEVGGSFNPLNYSPPSCLVFAGFYSDRECVNSIGRHDSFLPGVPKGSWSRRVVKTDPIPLATQGISLSLDCRFASHTPSPLTRFDDAILRPTVSPLILYSQLALGGGFEAILFVTNMREQPWNGGAQLDAGAWPEDRAWTLDGSDQTGESGFALELSSRDTKLSSRGEIVEEGRSQIFHSGVSTWANLEPARERPSTAAQHKSLGVAPAELTTAVWFPVARRPGLNTGLAIRRTTAPVRYSLFDSSGLLLETVTRDDFQGAQFFNEIFSEVPASFTGSVKVESDRGFYLTVLRQEILPGEGLSFQLTSIPATPVPIELIGSGSD